MDIKGIPNIYSLYKNAIISIDDILKYRENFNGGIFRKWLSSEDYDENEILKALINEKNNDRGIIKFSRFLYPNIIGIFNPLMGTAASAVDSYIVSKIIDGWRPSLFLDDVLKRNIDAKISAYEANKKREQFVARFGSIGRNDRCPCQSGKKYKRCHGS